MAREKAEERPRRLGVAAALLETRVAGAAPSAGDSQMPACLQCTCCSLLETLSWAVHAVPDRKCAKCTRRTQRRMPCWVPLEVGGGMDLLGPVFDFRRLTLVFRVVVCPARPNI